MNRSSFLIGGLRCLLGVVAIVGVAAIILNCAVALLSSSYAGDTMKAQESTEPSAFGETQPHTTYASYRQDHLEYSQY